MHHCFLIFSLACVLCVRWSPFSIPSVYSPVKVRIKWSISVGCISFRGVAKAKSTQTHPTLIDLLGFNYNEEFWTWVIRCKVNEYEMKLCYYYEFVNKTWRMCVQLSLRTCWLKKFDDRLWLWHVLLISIFTGMI